MKIGYARVSTKEQNLDLQTKALEEFGCDMIFSEKISSSSKKRDAYDKMLSHIRRQGGRNCNTPQWTIVKDAFERKVVEYFSFCDILEEPPKDLMM